MRLPRSLPSMGYLGYFSIGISGSHLGVVKVLVASGQAARPGIPEELLTVDEWMHVVGLYDGRAGEGVGEARVYLNGEPIDAHLGNDGSGGSGLTGLVRAVTDWR